jgi:GT2 family glycosyltransferase
VSVIMPVRDEGRYLEEAVRRIRRQVYPGEMQVVIAVGPSRDDTAEVAARLASADERVRVVDNPTGRTPAGLNLGIRASEHPVVVRVDGHGLLPDGYVATAVDVLRQTGADNVGGMMVPKGNSSFEQAVAWAMSSRWGIGGARFHVGGDEGPVDSVYLGVFRRQALERVGGFDETFERAQDWELNHRLRAAGGTVWFTPRLHVTYRPRSNLVELARQFYTTGQWRRQVFSRYPGTMNLRYLAPPTAVVVIGAGTAIAATGTVTGTRWATAGWLGAAGYLATVGIATVIGSRDLPRPVVARLPLVLATMHLAWGAGFLRGVRRIRDSGVSRTPQPPPRGRPGRTRRAFRRRP